MSVFRTLLFSCALAAGAGAGAARADMAEGVWKSTPDRNGLVVHVRARSCGGALCGTVERAKDRRGYDKRSTAVGRRIFWDMVEQPDGAYRGKLWEPDRNRTMDARIEVHGNAMRVQRCEDSQTCRDVIWTRLR